MSTNADAAGVAGGVSKPIVSVVIPVLNGAHTIWEQLDALLAQRCPVLFEVVISDNGSTDGTREVVAKYAIHDPRVRMIDASSCSLGGAAAKNLGVHCARAEMIAFCDADDVVGEGWLAAMVEGLKVHPVVLAKREYGLLNPFYPQRASIGLVRFQGVPVFGGGAFGIRRSLYLSIGGFDESMRGAVDDEFAVRLFALTGNSPVPAPGALVHCRLRSGVAHQLRRETILSKSVPFISLRYRESFPAYRPMIYELKVLLWTALRVKRLLGPRRSEYLRQCTRAYGQIVGIIEYGVASLLTPNRVRRTDFCAHRLSESK